MKIVIIEPLGITPEKLAEATAAVKARGHEIVAYDTKEEDQDKLAERGKDADIIIIANQPFRKNVIEKCKNLKLLSVAFTGVDHIDVDFCKEKGICVCNAAGYSTNAVAELAFGLAISVLRNIPACDAVCRKEGTKAGLVGGELFGKTFGVVGTGAIGSKVAKIAQAFGCKVVAYSRTVKPEMQGAGIEYLSLEELFNKIATFTGGRVAEELKFGSITTGASNDIEQATRLARGMITRFGMSEEFGMVALETINNQYLGGDTSLACSNETATKIDAAVVAVVKQAHEKAVGIIRENMHKLDEIAQFLLEKETITGEEFMEILNRTEE